MVRDGLIVWIAIRIEGPSLVDNFRYILNGRPDKDGSIQQYRTWIIRRRHTRTGIRDVMIAKKRNQKNANSSQHRAASAAAVPVVPAGTHFKLYNSLIFVTRRLPFVC
eukprot:scaffold55599_cov59-Attheya_sp.AAC.1